MRLLRYCKSVQCGLQCAGCCTDMTIRWYRTDAVVVLSGGGMLWWSCGGGMTVSPKCGDYQVDFSYSCFAHAADEAHIGAEPT